MRVLAIISALFLVCRAGWAANPEPNCSAPKSTYDYKVCGGRQLEAARQELTHYLEASRLKILDDAQTLAALDESQKTWEAYEKAQCNALYTKWRQGSVAGVMEVECQVTMTKARTHELWKSWLTYADRTPPDLPEPAM
jgi:uncharacterized protein YecT (DUF1311 family)